MSEAVTILIPSSPILSSSGGVASKYFGEGFATVKDSFGLRLDGGREEEEDGELPSVEDIFRSNDGKRKMRDGIRGPLGKDDERNQKVDEGSRRTVDGRAHEWKDTRREDDKRREGTASGDGYGKEDNVSIRSSSQVGEESMYFGGEKRKELSAEVPRTSREFDTTLDSKRKLQPKEVIEAPETAGQKTITITETTLKAKNQPTSGVKESREELNEPCTAHRSSEKPRLKNSQSVPESDDGQTTTGTKATSEDFRLENAGGKGKSKSKSKSKRRGLSAGIDAGAVEGAREVVSSKPKKRVKGKNANSEDQQKIKKTKITKPSSLKEALPQNAELARKGTEEGEASNILAISDEFVDLEELGLEKVIPRRQEWTPTKDQSKMNVVSSTTNDDHCAPDAKGQFDKVVGSFGYPTPNSSSTSKATSTTSVFTQERAVKRRKLDVCS